MLGSSLAVGCRGLVALVFVLTAVWKVSNGPEFESSFERLAPRRIAGLAEIALFPLAGTEIVLSVVLLLGIRVREVALVGPVVAFVLIGVFTAALALSGEGGCGCWFTPPGYVRGLRLLPIARNVALLGSLAAAAILSPHGIEGMDFAAGLAPFVTGLVLAVFLIESPQIAAAITFGRQRAEIGGFR